MFSKLFGHKSSNIKIDDPAHQELHRTQAAFENAQQRKLDEQEMLALVLQLSLYVPHPEPLLGDPPKVLDWKPVMVKKQGVMWQFAFTNLDVAREFQEENPFCPHGRVLKSEWIFKYLPENVGLAICYRRGAMFLVAPHMVQICKDFLAQKNVS